MLWKVWAAAFFMMLFVSVQSVHAAEVVVYHDTDENTTYCVDDRTVAYTTADIAFKVKVISYKNTYSPIEQWWFFEEEEDGTIAYVVGEGGRAYTVKRADNPAYAICKYCLKYLYGSDQPQTLNQ